MKKCSVTWCAEDAAWVRKAGSKDDKGRVFGEDSAARAVCTLHRPEWRKDWYEPIAPSPSPTPKGRKASAHKEPEASPSPAPGERNKAPF